MPRAGQALDVCLFCYCKKTSVSYFVVPICRRVRNLFGVLQVRRELSNLAKCFEECRWSRLYAYDFTMSSNWYDTSWYEYEVSRDEIPDEKNVRHKGQTLSLAIPWCVFFSPKKSNRFEDKLL